MPISVPWLRAAARASAASALFCLPMLCAWPDRAAQAAPEEIVVFTDQFEKPGEIGYELHVNYANRSRSAPDYEGEQAPNRILRVMPEFVWGLWEKWNLGLHFPGSRNANTGTVTVDGVKLRLHYLDTKDAAGGSVFYGANYELSAYKRRLSESSLVAEVRGILGLRSGDWMFAINPILNRPLNPAPGVDSRLNLDVFGKIMKSFGKNIAVGLEHYSELGRLGNLQTGSRSGQTTYAILEVMTNSHFDLHFGIGHGWTDSVDKRVYKMLIGFPF